MIALLNNIADKWFSWELAILWQVAVLVAIVWAVDLLIRKWAWPQVRYALWLLILVKLVLPPTLTSPVSFTSGIPAIAEKTVKVNIGQQKNINLIAQLLADTSALPVVDNSTNIESPAPIENDTLPVEAQTAYVPSSETVVSDAAELPVTAIPAASDLAVADAPTPNLESASAGKPALSIKVYAMFIWLAGVIALSAWLIVRLLNFRREHLKTDLQRKVPESFYKLLNATAARLKLKRLPEVILTDKVRCPAVFGVFKPVLLMPAGKLETLSRQDCEHILLHELAHIKRGDLIIHAAHMCLQIVFWFNPLLWMIRKHLQNLRELCCDATVSKLLKENTYKYRETLLETARQLLAEPVDPGLGLMGLFENSNWLIHRLKWLEKNTWKNRPLRILTVFTTTARHSYVSGCIHV